MDVGSPTVEPAPRVRLRRYVAFGAALWTAALGLSLAWNVQRAHGSLGLLARAVAQASYEKDLLYRRWNASHGGVYVPITDATPPNPWLDAPERDVVTTGGRRLTLVNPAYMTRQVYELGQDRAGQSGHLTSLTPLRPENLPDAWEAAALRRFEAGDEDLAEEVMQAGAPVLRYMGRLMVEASCLGCHERQGYKVGDVRGGISVTVPLAAFASAEGAQVRGLELGHAGIWVVGLLGLALAGRRLRTQLDERDQAHDELRRAEHALARSRRLESVGQLAGALAHDLNNILTPVLSRAGAALEEAVPGSPVHQDLAHVVEAAGRAHGLCDRLLAFARRQPLEVKLLDLSEVTARLLPMLRDVAGQHATVATSLAEGLPAVSADRGQIETVLVNLIANARDAMPAGGALGLTTRSEALDERAIGGLDLRPGRYVVLEVEDHGIGMSRETLAHLFEPFYTTKDVGKGTGLGLASVHGIVTRHRGAVAVRSEPGHGTTFRILLPASDGVAEVPYQARSGLQVGAASASSSPASRSHSP